MAQSGTHCVLKSNELLKQHDRMIGMHINMYIVQYLDRNEL